MLVISCILSITVYSQKQAPLRRRNSKTAACFLLISVCSVKIEFHFKAEQLQEVQRKQLMPEILCRAD